MVSLPKRRNLKSVWGLPRALALLGATGISITTGFSSSSAPRLRCAEEAEGRQRDRSSEKIPGASASQRWGM